MADWQSYLDAHQSRFVDELVDFVGIPSVSADPAHRADVDRAADWVAARLDRAGAQSIEIIPSTGHPCVYADWLHAGAGSPTILVYGHFDVQPAVPDDLWTTPPFQPDIRDGRVYGRGASDDKGGMLIPILAFEAMMQAGGPPVNIKFLFEGQEEIGSPDMPSVIAREARRLAADMIFSADGLQWSADEPMLVVALKGLTGLEITVDGARSDLHSGLHGGAIANPLQALSHILAGLKAADGTILVDGFFDGVADLTEEDKADIARAPYDEAAYIDELGVPDVAGEPGYTARERNWARPTLELNGIWGGYQGEGTKTVLPREAHAKITCRLVAGQDPDDIYDKIRTHAEKIAPDGVRVTVKRLPGSADPFQMPRGHNGSQIAREVLHEIYGQDPYVARVGGSIPIVSMFLKELGVHSVMFGFSVGDENLHAPDEFIRLKNFERGQRAYCRLFERLAAGA